MRFYYVISRALSIVAMILAIGSDEYDDVDDDDASGSRRDRMGELTEIRVQGGEVTTGAGREEREERVVRARARAHGKVEKDRRRPDRTIDRKSVV